MVDHHCGQHVLVDRDLSSLAADEELRFVDQIASVERGREEEHDHAVGAKSPEEPHEGQDRDEGQQVADNLVLDGEVALGRQGPESEQNRRAGSQERSADGYLGADLLLEQDLQHAHGGGDGEGPENQVVGGDLLREPRAPNGDQLRHGHRSEGQDDSGGAAEQVGEGPLGVAEVDHNSGHEQLHAHEAVDLADEVVARTLEQILAAVARLVHRVVAVLLALLFVVHEEYL